MQNNIYIYIYIILLIIWLTTYDIKYIEYIQINKMNIIYISNIYK